MFLSYNFGKILPQKKFVKRLSALFAKGPFYWQSLKISF